MKKGRKYYNARTYKDIALLYYIEWVVNENGERVLQKGVDRLTQSEYPWYFCIRKTDAEANRKLLKGLRDDGLIRCISDDNGNDYFRIYCHNVAWDKYCDSAQVISELSAARVPMFENDVRFHNRYLLDKDIPLEDTHKIGHFDIETDDRKAGVVPGRDRIVSVSITDRNGDKFYYSDKSERVILEQTIDKMSEYTIITGWHSTGFDWPALELRCEFNDVDFSIKDVNHVDLLVWFKKALQAGMLEERPKNFKLGDCCEQYLGITKTEGVQAGGGNIWNLFCNNPKLLKEYNEQDTWLLKCFDEKLGIIDQCIRQSIISKSFVGGLNQKQGGATSSELVDKFLLTLSRKRNIRLGCKNNNAKKPSVKRISRKEIDG